MKLLICMDDTDNLESIGTGELLENLCRELAERDFGTGGFITRHQLFLSEQIAYTSHNSSMCTSLETNCFPKLLEFSRDYLAEHAAEGSDPGLCLYVCGNPIPDGLLQFGQKAQCEVLRKGDAFALAEQYPNRIFLSEHGGTGDGVIGALAGVALRLTGNDGRIKGKIFSEVEGEILPASELCRKYGAEQILSEAEGTALPDTALVRFDSATKAVYRNNKISLLANREQDVWVIKPKKKGGKAK